MFLCIHKLYTLSILHNKIDSLKQSHLQIYPVNLHLYFELDKKKYIKHNITVTKLNTSLSPT